MATKRDTANKKAAVLKALEASLGVVTPACKQVGISRVTFYEWKKTDEDFCNAVDEMRDVALDFVESQLFKQIKAGVPASTIYYLKTQGRKRGYIERTNVDHTSKGEKIEGFEITIIDPQTTISEN